ncbi:hypothetical protein MPDQ_004592 [Monascus purpureus]|uniref:Minor histocompatibility antigen H13 n=1 Tax=Monascus purpureus TaxID=5098 RepID=A0A507R359_MONPU|nr:hypothetical protein MPDQ_004592 [Monascus purpureus]BDD61583.1 hypothetical protein MAP00_006624 [Monascus purpureus]
MPNIGPVAEFLGHVFYEFEAVKHLLPTYGHLIVSALFPIYIGAHASLTRPSSAAKPPKHSKSKDEYDTDDEDDGEGKLGPIQKMEGLEPSDAVMLPLTAGLTLGGLYLVIKWLEDPAILNKILSFYFSQMGIFFAVAFLKDALCILRSFIFPRMYRTDDRIWRGKQSNRTFITTAGEDTLVRHSPLPGRLGQIPLPNSLRQTLWACRNFAYQRLRFRAYIRGILDLKCLVGLLDLISTIVGLSAVGYFAFVKKPWWLTNFLGFSFCYGSLQFMSPSTFATGSLILGSLFVYDIYFVFFTPLMVTVATKLDVPIKLLFPRPPSPGEEPDTISLAMLGLGDIVIPGMMIGLALRFDLFLYYRRKGIQKALAEGKGRAFVRPQYQSATGAWGERFWTRLSPPREPELEPPYHDARSFSKTYFKASLVGYTIGMIATLVAMLHSNHAQPALLYLVPAVLTSLWGTALFRGEIRSMWEFSDADDDDEPDAVQKREQAEREQKDKSAKNTKGLLMRLFSGDTIGFYGNATNEEKTSSDKKANKEDGSHATLSGERDSQTRKDKDQDDEVDKTSNLVTISLSFPRKKSQGSTSEAGQPVPFLVGLGDGEPPYKRRRRSPGKENQ